MRISDWSSDVCSSDLEARVPVLAHLDGICHTYIDAAADPGTAVALAVNAKMRRTGICGATETILIALPLVALAAPLPAAAGDGAMGEDRKSTRLNSSH